MNDAIFTSKKFLNRWKKTDLIKCEILWKNSAYLHAKEKRVKMRPSDSTNETTAVIIT